ncbi:MAG: TetR/AcrR family transcriptional regulator [Nevskiales bacterium]
MSRKATRSPAPRLAREQRVDEILAAARDLFSERGYEQAAVSEIAARIGVVEGTVFKYFATKRELLLKVLENWYEEMFGDYARDLAGVSGHRARLRLLVWRHLRSVRDFPLLCRLMFREVRSEQDYHGSDLHGMNRRYTQFLLDVIQDGIAAGEFRADLSPALLRDLVYGGIEHHTWNYMMGTAAKGAGGVRVRGGLDIDTIAEQITAVLCEGIGTADLRQEMQRLTQIANRIEKAFPGAQK